MSVKVKICGVTEETALNAAIAAGADFAGLVFFPPSPRHLDMATAARLARAARGRIAVTALVVDADDALIRAIARHVRPDYVQLHGAESPRRAAEIAQMAAAPVVRAFRVRAPADVRAADAYAGVIAFPVFDAWVDAGKSQGLPGGTGHAFDWDLLKGRTGPFMLAGGLTPENVAGAIRRTGAPMVDVSSGVESARGVKDAERIKAFVKAAKAAPGPA